MNISEGKAKLKQLKGKSKYQTMIQAASIITKILENDNIKPIIVGGLSVEIYTQQDYSTRDIDFVAKRHDFIEHTLLSLGFQKDGRVFYNEEIEVVIEIPDSTLAGSYEKVTKVSTGQDKYIYLISVEDLILDRIRAGVHWKSEEDQLWAFKLLAGNFSWLDKDYLLRTTETPKETELLREWLDYLQEDN